MGLRLRDLAPGTKFRYPVTGRTAVLLALGASGARIKYDNTSRHVKIKTELADAEFEAPGRPVLVSDGSEVEVLEVPSCGCEDDSCEIPQAEPKQE